MKRFQICINSFRKACSKIHLIDKCLIIIMFLLLIQSSYGLFFEAVSSAESNTIDVIVRTATASIFGYFLSSNFSGIREHQLYAQRRVSRTIFK